MFCPQEGACNIPVPKSILKNPLNFDHSNFKSVKFGDFKCLNPYEHIENSLFLNRYIEPLLYLDHFTMGLVS